MRVYKHIGQAAWWEHVFHCFTHNNVCSGVRSINTAASEYKDKLILYIWSLCIIGAAHFQATLHVKLSCLSGVGSEESGR
jgi:uncharacterized protein (UPF0254 family)